MLQSTTVSDYVRNLRYSTFCNDEPFLKDPFRNHESIGQAQTFFLPHAPGKLTEETKTVSLSCTSKVPLIQFIQLARKNIITEKKNHFTCEKP